MCKTNRVLLFILSCVIAISSCKTKKKTEEIAIRDTTITKEISFTELFIDTTALSAFYLTNEMPDSLQGRMQSFYNQRNYQYAWFFPDGLAEFVPTFLSLQADYIHYSGDSTLFNPRLTAQIDSLKQRTRIDPKDKLVITTELMLTAQFFAYANRAYEGDQKINIHELDWFIPRKKIDTQALLDSLVKNQGRNFTAYEPVNRQYNLLKNQLLQFNEMVKNGDTTKLQFSKKIRSGMASEEIRAIKIRLRQLGDLAKPDTSSTFDSTMLVAVKQFQSRMGLKPDGEIGASFIREINISASERIRQILINMERIRWMPATPKTDYILVNIPEFQMHVYEKGELAFNMVVVVGSEAHSTVIFSGKLNQVVFSPYWNVPPSILKNEILPGIKRRSNYLARHNMEWNGNSVRQKPGKSNSLGLVKFLFPNSYNIYFHDTPSKSLFGETSRAFSHGCIRLSEPEKLAKFLLRTDTTWTAKK